MTGTLSSKSAEQPVRSEISLVEVISALIRRWKTVVMLPLALALIFGINALSTPRSFVAKTTFVSQTGESRGLGGAAALAQQFGVSFGNDRPGQSPQFYEDLLRTRTILRRAVESKYEIPRPMGQPVSQSLIDYWDFRQLDESYTPLWRKAADRLRSAIGTTVRRETGVIEMTVTVADAEVAEQVASRLLELLNEYNMEVRQVRARQEGRFLSGRASEVLRELGVAENALENFLRRNRDFRVSPELTFEHDRLQRIVLAQQGVYASLLTAQEQARMDGMRDTPVLQIIDSPVGSAQPASRKVALRTVIGFMFGVIIAVFIAMVGDFVRSSRQGRDPRYEELEALVRGVWTDLRRPLGRGGPAD